MSRFTTFRGKCSVNESVTIESSFFTQFVRIYNGNKLLFALMAAVPGYLLVSLIFDWAIFVREIAIIALIGGIVGGGILIAALKILARRSNITGQNKILIEHIQYIALVENGTIRPPEVRIAFQGSNEQNLQFRILRLPYQWMNGMDDELHAAEEVFSKKGVEIRKVES